jgi:osmotically-inducible protein OsmY
MKLRMALFLSAVLVIALGAWACDTGSTNSNSNMASASPASTNTPAPRAEPTVGTGRGQYTEEQARQERERAFGNKETIGQSLDDAWIHTKIVAKLIGDKTTPERNINVDVVEGTVTLRGNVDTADANTEGVTKVINQLKVVASKTGNANKTVNPNTNKQKTSY